MQAGQLTIANFAVGHIEPSSVGGRIGNLMARVFGCWHVELSRPFSHDGRAYRSCLRCGAQRQFNLSNWQMQGNFYYGKPSAKPTPSLSSFAALRQISN
jgi:hypothetical protein